jgi:alpha-1,3-rhamnosyl/mannosyltransferase
MDGVGVYTYNVLENLKKIKTVKITPVYFNLPWLLSLHEKNAFYQEPHAFLNPFLPFNLHNDLEKSIDIFHAPDFFVPKLKKTPVITTIHDAATFTAVNMVNPRFRRMKNYFLKKHASYADHIITVSHSVVEDIVNYWRIDSKKISVIYSGVSEDWFDRIPQEEVIKILNVYKINQPFLLSVGTVQQKKNYTRILDAYMQLPKAIKKSIKLVIVGKVGSSPLAEIKKIQRLHAEGHIQWLNHVAFEHLKALYQSAIALIFPSLNEGFGLPILEGFASQLPVLTSEFGAMKEVASNAAFFVNPYKVDSICEGMEKLISSSSLRDDLITRGLIRVKDFSWARCVKKVYEIYKLFV